MRAASAMCFVLAGLALLVGAWGAGEPGLGILALAASVIVCFASRRSPFAATASLIMMSVLAVMVAVAGSNVLLPAVAVVAALHGWDTSLAARRLLAFSRSETQPILVRYAISSAGIAGVGIALVALASAVHVRFSFGLALGLSGAFLVLAAVVGGFARPRRPRPSEEAADRSAK
jgi:hypothetical protein